MNIELLRHIIKKRKFLINISDESFGTAVKSKRSDLQLSKHKQQKIFVAFHIYRK